MENDSDVAFLEELISITYVDGLLGVHTLEGQNVF